MRKVVLRSASFASSGVDPAVAEGTRLAKMALRGRRRK